MNVSCFQGMFNIYVIAVLPAGYYQIYQGSGNNLKHINQELHTTVASDSVPIRKLDVNYVFLFRHFYMLNKVLHGDCYILCCLIIVNESLRLQ